VPADHPQTTYEQLFTNNRRWVEDQLARDPDYFERLAAGQRPAYLFIGCSDSRVNANEITGTGPGEMFIHRNIANVVVHTDMNLMSVLQFAVEVLGVDHVIVCGHYGCGGVLAAVDGHYHGLIDKWLRSIKDVYRLYRSELDAIDDPELRHRRLVELNVREQVYRICATSFVQRAWHHERQLHVHGWVYDIHEGLLRDLHVDPEREFDGAGVYDYDYEDIAGGPLHGGTETTMAPAPEPGGPTAGSDP
jgi:carbonic anhydrase